MGIKCICLTVNKLQTIEIELRISNMDVTNMLSLCIHLQSIKYFTNILVSIFEINKTSISQSVYHSFAILLRTLHFANLCYVKYKVQKKIKFCNGRN